METRHQARGNEQYSYCSVSLQVAAVYLYQHCWAVIAAYQMTTNSVA